MSQNADLSRLREMCADRISLSRAPARKRRVEHLGSTCRHPLLTIGVLMRFLLIAIACCLGAASNASAADIKSISRLAAGPENVLFVADWKSAHVHAITLPRAMQKPAGTTFNILDLQDLLSSQVGGAKVTVEDMVVRPGTAEVYIAVSYGAAKTPALFRVTSDQRAHRVNLKAGKSTSVALRDAPTSNYKF